jgi:hypothetical protein
MVRATPWAPFIRGDLFGSAHEVDDAGFTVIFVIAGEPVPTVTACVSRPVLGEGIDRLGLNDGD